MQQLDFDTNAHWQDAWKEQDPTLQKRINIDQLRQVFLSLGKDISAKDLNACAKGGNNCNFEMFSDFMSSLPKQGANIQDIRNSVTILSQYTGGQLKTSELRLLLTTQGERLTNDEAAALVSDSDPRSTGYVDVEPFADLIINANN